LEWLKIQADINDPLIKKRFEDGEGTEALFHLKQ
jgi:large subunit ribosomal protein L35